MNARPLSIPPRTGQVGVDVHQAVVALVRNRGGGDYTAVYNRVREHHGDLMKPGYDNLSSSFGFTRLLNRVESKTGLSIVAAIEMSADQVTVLTNRFARPLATLPTAIQWDCLWRAADVLEKQGVPARLLNRDGPDEVGKRDWKNAVTAAGDVFAMLSDEAIKPVDRGSLLENARACQLRGVFRSAITQLMGPSVDPKRPGNLSRSQAFDWLKEKEPIFWCAAMLSFEPET